MSALMDHRDDYELVFLDVVVEVVMEPVLPGSSNVILDDRGCIRMAHEVLDPIPGRIKKLLPQSRALSLVVPLCLA